MVKRIVGMLVGAFLGFMVQAVLIPDVNPLICIIAGGVLGFALPIVSIIATILFLLVGSGYGKERRRR